MKQDEVTLSTRRIYDGRIVKLRVDTIRLPDNREAQREVIEHGGSVGIVPMQDRQTVLLVRQWRQPAGKIILEIPAGGIEPGETPEACAHRELTEEIQMTPGRLIPLFACYLAPGYSSEKMYGFLALDLTHRVGKPDDDESLEIVALRLEDALSQVQSGKIDDVKTIAGLLLAAQLLPTL